MTSSSQQYPALTTAFTPPASCSSWPWTYYDYGGGDPSAKQSTTITLHRPFEYGLQLTSSFSQVSEGSCLPSGYYEGVGTFSPGVCPSGQTTATAYNSQGVSVAICCPSGFVPVSQNQACQSTFTTPTTVNYIGIPNTADKYKTQVLQTGVTVGPAVLEQRALVMRLPSTTTTATTTNAVQATQSRPSESAIMSHGISGPPNGAIVAISAVLGVAALALLFLARGFLQRRGARKSKGSYPVFSTIGAIFLLPVVVAILTGVACCVLASRRDFQDEIIRRWASPNSVLRLVQVLSLIVRLCATVFGWCMVTDLGWLMISRGAQPAQTIRMLNMIAAGGSYATVWNALSASLHRTSWLSALALLLALLVALCADLVGNAIIAGTGVGLTAGPNITMTNVPFVQVGFVGGDNQNFGSDDQVMSLYSSAAYYPHMVQLNDSLAFLPIEPSEAVPASYHGNAYFGSMDAKCLPAKISRSVGVVNYDPVDGTSNLLQMSGDLELPFDNLPQLTNATFSKRNVAFSRTSTSKPDPILGVWSLSLPSTDPGVRYFATLLLSNITEAFLTADLTKSPASQGTLLINDASSNQLGQPAGSFSIQVCRATLPSSYGTVAIPRISQKALPQAACSIGAALCPNITIYDGSDGASVDSWNDSYLLQRLNAQFTNSQTLTVALLPFTNGTLFCHSCNVTGLAARVLSTYLADAASTPNFSDAFRTALLHAIASTYRIELPTLNGAGSATFTALESATLITGPAWIYASIAYVWLLALAALALRRYTLSVVGVDRSGNVLSISALLAEPSPFAQLVREGSGKPAEVLQEDVSEEMSHELVRLGEVAGDGGRFCIRNSGRPGSKDGPREWMTKPKGYSNVRQSD